MILKDLILFITPPSTATVDNTAPVFLPIMSSSKGESLYSHETKARKNNKL